MNCEKVSIVLGLVVLTLISIGFSVLSSTNEEVQKSELRIKQLQLKADSISSANVLLHKRIESQLSKIDEIQKQIQVKDQKINQLRKNVEESVASVDTVGYDGLVRFFTDRYNQSFSTNSDSTSYN